MSITVPISIGEFIDKLTILEVKSERIHDPAKLRNVEHELAVLRAIWRDSAHRETDIDAECSRLKALNGELWDIEDRIRCKEGHGEFDAEFIHLARSIYRLNDERACIKRALSAALGSDLIEEKSYTDETAAR